VRPSARARPSRLVNISTYLTTSGCKKLQRFSSRPSQMTHSPSASPRIGTRTAIALAIVGRWSTMDGAGQSISRSSTTCLRWHSDDALAIAAKIGHKPSENPQPTRRSSGVCSRSIILCRRNNHPSHPPSAPIARLDTRLLRHQLSGRPPDKTSRKYDAAQHRGPLCARAHRRLTSRRSQKNNDTRAVDPSFSELPAGAENLLLTHKYS